MADHVPVTFWAYINMKSPLADHMEHTIVCIIWASIDWCAYFIILPVLSIFYGDSVRNGTPCSCPGYDSFLCLEIKTVDAIF